MIRSMRNKKYKQKTDHPLFVWRKKNDIHRDKMAKDLGLHHMTIYFWECGDTPTIKNAKQVEGYTSGQVSASRMLGV